MDLEEKTCSKCALAKPATAEFFHKNPRLSGGLVSTCKVCYAARSKEWEARNPERLRAYLAKYRARIYARKKVWRERNPERSRLHTRNRRALIKGAGGSHTAEDIKRLYEEQKGRCVYCDVELGSKYDVDHVCPIARGGSNDASNLQLLCKSCNCRKHIKLPEQFIAEMARSNNG